MTETDYLIQRALRTIDIEHRAIGALMTRIDDSFAQACALILACKGRVVVLGMGKSGLIGRKIAATLSSTGSPAMFVHPGEASHGDLGMITDKDVVIAISYSGTASEILTLMPILKRKGIPIISLTGNKESLLATVADVHLDGCVEEEACPLGSAGARRCAGDGAHGGPWLHARGIRFLPPRRQARQASIAQGQRRHALRRCYSEG